MEFDDLQPLRRSGANEGEQTPPDVQPEYPPGAGISGSALAQLVADLIETTGLVPLDRLAMARSRAGSGSLAQAIMDEGLTASSELLLLGELHCLVRLRLGFV